MLDSMIRIDSLVDKVVEMGQTACAITDHGTLAGAVKFVDACTKKHIKPILGQEFYIAPDSRHRRKYAKGEHYSSHLILLAKTARGWDNLRTLSSLAYTEGFYDKPRIDHELLARYSEDLICSTACMGGDISIHLKSGMDAEGEGKVEFDPGLAAAKLNWYVSIFGPNFFIELQEHGQDSAQVGINNWYRERYPAEMMYASADCHYLDANDWDTHDTLLCCSTVAKKHDPDRWRFPSDQCWLKTTDEMASLFYENEIENTMRIADSIEFELPLRKQWFMPELPKDILQRNTPEIVFRRECLVGMVDRHYGAGSSINNEGDFSATELFEEMPQEYRDRLTYEMDVFVKAGFCEYALILWDLMEFCRREEIFTGDGRGSGAGSLVLYALGIVNVDPIQRDCPFERFINPGRLENFAPPDVDLDFPKTRRREVIEYLRQRYGNDRVAHIGTYASLGPPGLIRKLAVPLGISKEMVSKLTAIIPEGEATKQGSGAASEEHGLSLDDVYRQSAAFRQLITGMGDTGKWLLHYGRGLRNLGTHASTHASGIIITNRPVSDIVPMMVANANDPKKTLTLGQFDMFDAEAIGLVKFDILGLDTLDVLADCEKSIRDFEDASFSFLNIDLDDPAAYDLLCDGRTVGIFQASGGGFGRLLPQAKPRTVEDLAILTSLCRPGPTLAGATEAYLRRRQSKEPVAYDIDELEPILNKNLGVLAFQEDIMAIAHKLAGFTLAEADELRKAMGKKDAAKMAKQRPAFIAGMESYSHISPFDAEQLWDKLVPMAEYVFNRSHAMAYSYTTAKCAWAKAHYPAFFLAAAMTADTTGTNSGASLPIFVRDALISNCRFVPPDINDSNAGYKALNKTTIRLGLRSIAGVGPAATEVIIEERNARGPFVSRVDFRRRIAPKSANKAVMDALILAGAFDVLESVTRESTIERLNEEFALFGFFMSGHPCERYRSSWESAFPDLVTLLDVENDWKKVAGYYHGPNGRRRVFQFAEKHVRAIISRVEKKKSKRSGAFMWMLDLEDDTHSMKMIVNAKQLEKYGNPEIKKGGLLDLVGRKEDPERGWAGYFSPSQLSVIAH